MINSTKSRFRLNISVFFTLSLLLHGLFVIFLETSPFSLFKLMSPVHKKNFYSPPQPIEIIRAQDVERIKKKILSKQIVNSDQNGLKKKSISRFLGKKTQSFEKQTIARKTAPHKEAGRGEAREKRGQAAQKINLQSLGSSNLKVPRWAPVKPKNLGLKNGQKDLKGLASSSDFVEDVPLGDLTQLNTNEFKYFGFYDRMRKRLEEHWGVSLMEKANSIMGERGRKIASNENYITSLTIVLNQEGQIIKVSLRGSSGIRELDEVAISSINRASPFPNPPKELVKNGFTVVRWSFVVQS